MCYLFRLLSKITGLSPFEVRFQWIAYKVANPDVFTGERWIRFINACLTAPADSHFKYRKIIEGIESLSIKTASVSRGFKGMAKNIKFAGESFKNFSREARRAEEAIGTDQAKWEEQ